MIAWRNVREGDELLRVSEDGRFVVRRKVLSDGIFRYEAVDVFRGQIETVETLQAACLLAEDWFKPDDPG